MSKSSYRSARFLLPVMIVTVALGVLIYSASRSGAKAVVTVEELVVEGTVRKNVRLGAKVADSEIVSSAEPRFSLRFAVTGIGAKNGGDSLSAAATTGTSVPSSAVIPVVYYGVRPDTFQVGRDVILEGDFDGRSFEAKMLMTQCPSKYEPPKPPGADGLRP